MQAIVQAKAWMKACMPALFSGYFFLAQTLDINTADEEKKRKEQERTGTE